MVFTSPVMPARDWARASGMYTSASVTPCPALTMPTTVKFLPATLIVEPVLRLSALA